mmetsp:Transcript_31869/g.57994  ORF Transcript_31869/g.57994 Transcript_31869/m.57994 type:complete len:84 (-) Transcript_31869:83-334(-)
MRQLASSKPDLEQMHAMLKYVMQLVWAAKRQSKTRLQPLSGFSSGARNVIPPNSQLMGLRIATGARMLSSRAPKCADGARSAL